VSPPACSAGQIDGDLTVYNWRGYIDPGQLEAFGAAFGVSVSLESFDAETEMRREFESGGMGVDVVVSSASGVAALIDSGAVSPLSREAIPNTAAIADHLVGLPHDPDGSHSVPYLWGTTGLAVNEEILGEVYPRTWGLVFDPVLSAPFAGRIQLMDDPRETLGAALRYLGYSLNTTEAAELTEAADLLAATVERLHSFDTAGGDELLAAGQTVVGHGYSDDMFTQAQETDNPDEYVYFVPEEGGALWVDTFAVAADAANPCTGHTFIDWMYTEEQGAALANWAYAYPPVDGAIPMLDEAFLEFVSDAAVLPGGVGSLEMIEPVGEGEAAYREAFETAKG